MTKEVMKYDNITPAQVDLIKSQIAVGATDDELKLFLYVADKSGLDPLTKQIYFIKRGGKMTIQTAIDGFRAIADRTGQYSSSDEPIFEEIGNSPVKATVTVGKIVQGVVGKFTASARWSEYYPEKGNTFMWDKMPNTMLGKCAEALALRKAFPAQLSGLYTGDEMDQAGKDGIPNQGRNINPKGGSKQLEESLKGELIRDAVKPIVLDIPTPVSKEDSVKAFEDAQSKLDESFAFHNEKEIHDRIINNLNDIKYERSEENTEVLGNFADTYRANQQLFQNIAHKYQEEWMKAMKTEDWNKLVKYMTELDKFFPEEEIVTVKEAEVA